MRVATLLTALSLVGLAAAQRPQEVHEATIWDAYQNFRADGDTFVFEVRGTETVGNSTVPVHAVLYWRNSNDARTGLKSRAEVELDVYEPTSVGERMSMRIVGDGTTLRRYDLNRGTVSSTTYGFYGERAPDNYGTNVKSDAPKLALQLRPATPGLPTYLARLVSEINLASGFDFGPRFASWIPGSPSRYFDEVPLALRDLSSPISAAHYVLDPATGRKYYRGDPATHKYVFEGFDGTASIRTTTFTLDVPDPENHPDYWTLTSVNLGRRSEGRTVDLVLTPRTGTPPAWAFQPYTGAQGAAFRPTTPEP